MAIWRSLLGLVRGAAYRQKGVQSGETSYYTSSAAVPVTLDSSLQLSAVWACVKLISESIGSLPINIYRKENGSRVIDTEHPLARLFSGKVNRWQTKQEFMETLTYQLVMLGNNYSAVQRNSRGEIVALVPLMSEQMQVTLQESGDVQYKYTDGTNVSFYSPQTIWHNKLFGNGIIGLSPLSYARSCFGIAQATELAVTNVYKNGGKPSGVLTIDTLLTPEQRAVIKQNFSDMLIGNENRLFTLEAGMKFQPTAMSPQDIELLSARRFQIEDIARFFGVPSVLINDTSASTTWGSGIQQIVQGFYKLGLRPYLERYEASMKSWLLSPEDRQRYDIEFDFEALLRPDRAERLKMYKEAVQGGLMAPNEGRSEEGWASKAGGDDLYMQQQMIKLDSDLRGQGNGQEQP